MGIQVSCNADAFKRRACVGFKRSMTTGQMDTKKAQVLVTQEMLHQRRKRLYVIKEIYETERTYANLLATFMTAFIHPIMERIERREFQLTESDGNDLFQNFHEIATLHRELLVCLREQLSMVDEAPEPSISETPVAAPKQLPEPPLNPPSQPPPPSTPPPNPSRVLDSYYTLQPNTDGAASLLVAFSGRMNRLYTQYIANYDTIVAKLRVAKLQDPEFAAFLDSVANDGMNNPPGLDMASYLILPVQRIPRYLMLLSLLKKHTPEDDPLYSTDFRESVNLALDVMTAIADSVNSFRRVENEEKKSTGSGKFKRKHSRNNSLIFGLDQAVVSAVQRSKKGLNLTARALLKCGELSTKSSLSKSPTVFKHQVVLLFSDALVWASLKNKFKGIINVVTAQLEEVETKDDETFRLVITGATEMTRGKPVSLEFEFEFAHEFDSWNRALIEAMKSGNRVRSRTEVDPNRLAVDENKKSKPGRSHTLMV